MNNNNPWIQARRLVQALVCALPMGMAAAQAPVPKTPTAEPFRIALIEGLSGPLANTGEAVYRNLVWATERVNARGGVALPGGNRPLVVERFDSKAQAEESLAALRSAVDQGITVVAQGNSSAAASALIDAINKHNGREPQRQVLLLNYSAVVPALTNEQCSFWHFRFDAHADMRMAALMGVLREDSKLQRIYLIGQDYSFGQAVLQEARRQLADKRPDVRIVGDELHPMARIKDFLPYATKIKASGAQAVLTGNWGNDLTLLVKAAREVGFEGSFYTFYGNALGVPAALGEAGVGKVLAVAEWHPNVGTPASDAFYEAFRARFPRPEDDYVHMRMQALVEMLVAAMEKARGTEAAAVAAALAGARLDPRHLGAGVHAGEMRAGDHQFIPPLYVSMMQRAGSPGQRLDVQGPGFGFRTVRFVAPAATAQPHRCRMPS